MRAPGRDRPAAGRPLSADRRRHAPRDGRHLHEQHHVPVRRWFPTGPGTGDQRAASPHRARHPPAHACRPAAAADRLRPRLGRALHVDLQHRHHPVDGHDRPGGALPARRCPDPGVDAATGPRPDADDRLCGQHRRHGHAGGHGPQPGPDREPAHLRTGQGPGISRMDARRRTDGRCRPAGVADRPGPAPAPAALVDGHRRRPRGRMAATRPDAPPGTPRGAGTRRHGSGLADEDGHPGRGLRAAGMVQPSAAGPPDRRRHGGDDRRALALPAAGRAERPPAGARRRGDPASALGHPPAARRRLCAGPRDEGLRALALVR